MKKELKLLLNEEKELYFRNRSTEKKMKHSKHKRFYIYMYLFHFRYCQYYRNLRNNKKALCFSRFYAKYQFRYHEKKKNLYSYKSGIEIGLDSCIGRGCDIWHSGVVINGNIGDYCVFHGNNIIGNKGKGKENLKPNIGSFVDIGAGAIVIGDVDVADNCKIGAGAVVTKSFLVPDTTIIGVPGHIK